VEQVDALLGAAVRGLGGEGRGGELGPGAAARGGALGEHVRRTHGAKVADQRGQAGVAQRDAVDVDHRHDEPGGAKQPGERRRLDARMSARRGGAGEAVGGEHRAAQRREAVPAGEPTDERAVGDHRAADRLQRRTQAIDGVEGADRDDEIEARDAEVISIFLGVSARGGGGEQRAGVDRLDRVGLRPEAAHPGGIGDADQQRGGEAARHVGEAVEAFGEGALVEEQLGADARGAVAASASQIAVEQVGGRRHGAACAAAEPARQGGMATVLPSPIKRLARSLLDFALPPRCAGCAEIIDEVDGFCADCWVTLEWLGDGGCARCGMPLESTDAEECGRCLAAPPPLERMRAAVAYGPLSRVIALKLKYGRKVALARTMARFMAPLRAGSEGAVLVPVPLHRRRLWWRGFNQSGLVARYLGARWGLPVDQQLIRRVHPTPALKGMNEAQRRRAVGGAFEAVAGRRLDGQTVILIDDVLTTGSTAAACAKALRNAGAGRVELISWARVVRPSRLMR
jgi:ComF family protein